MINLFISFGFLLTTSRVNGQFAFCNPVKVSLLAFFPDLIFYVFNILPLVGF